MSFVHWPQQRATYQNSDFHVLQDSDSVEVQEGFQWMTKLVYKASSLSGFHLERLSELRSQPSVLHPPGSAGYGCSTCHPTWFCSEASCARSVGSRFGRFCSQSVQEAWRSPQVPGAAAQRRATSGVINPASFLRPTFCPETH